VTVEEISSVLSRLYLEKKIISLILEIGAAKAMIALIPLAIFLSFPPLAALGTRGLIGYWKRRKERVQGGALPAATPPLPGGEHPGDGGQEPVPGDGEGRREP